MNMGLLCIELHALVQPYPDAWIVAIIVIKLKHVQLQCHVKESTMNKSGFLACSLLCLFYSFRLSPTDQSRLQVPLLLTYVAVMYC